MIGGLAPGFRHPVPKLNFMRLIKLAILSLVFFFLLITGISLFFPSYVRISRAIQLNAGRDSALALIKDPVRWKQWFPGADSAEFFIVDGKIKGIGTGDKQALMITEVTDSSVLAENAGPNSRKGEMKWTILNSNGTRNITLQWYMDFHLRWYPWEKFSSLLLEKSYGSKMEKGLSNLRDLLQAQK
jgi:hypothetical protein